MNKNELMDPSNGKKNMPANKADNTPAAKKSNMPEKAGEQKNAPAVKGPKEEKLPGTEVKKRSDDLPSDSTRPFNAGTVSKTNKVDDDYLAKKRNKKKKRKKILLCIGAAVLGLIVGVIGFLLWYKSYLFSKVTFIPETEVSFVNDEGQVVDVKKIREQIKPEIPVIENEDIKNFLLIGIDSRSKSYSTDGKGGLADVIMIMSIDNSKGTIKLVSVARDSYAYVPGYKNPCKINEAMSKGGPELLQLTVENTLRIPIDGYAYVNFYHMVGVIDAVGGVYVNLTGGEQKYLNEHLKEVNKISGYAEDYQRVTSTGDVWLNGRQAVAYARIRYLDNDYKRSERQVEVLRSILSQFMNMGLTGKASTIDDILGLVATNIPEDDITKYAFDFLPSVKNLKMQYFQLPLEGFFNGGMYGNEWSIRNNWNMTIPYVQEFLYGEQKEFDRVAEIPSAPSDDSCPKDFNVEEHIK